MCKINTILLNPYEKNYETLNLQTRKDLNKWRYILCSLK
jgi:hypothetical protein